MAYLTFNEGKLSAKERNTLKDEDFGIPELRKYPLHDKAHVISAQKLFRHCPPKYKAQLAKRIFAKMDYYGIPKDSIGENNELRKYLDKE